MHIRVYVRIRLNRAKIHPKGAQMGLKSIPGPPGGQKGVPDKILINLHASGQAFGIPGGPQKGKASPGNPKKTPQDQRTREKRASGTEQKKNKKCEHVAFSSFWVCGPS